MSKITSFKLIGLSTHIDTFSKRVGFWIFSWRVKAKPRLHIAAVFELETKITPYNLLIDNYGVHYMSISRTEIVNIDPYPKGYNLPKSFVVTGTVSSELSRHANMDHIPKKPCNPIGKYLFTFDYVAETYVDDHGNRMGKTASDTIEAYDSDHAILIFKDKHPGKQFDHPY